MADQPKPPVLLNPIPAFVVNIGAAFGPIDLKRYIKSPNEISGKLRFSGQLADGRALPNGMICTEDGLFGGIPAPETEGGYEVLLTVENDTKTPLLAQFKFSIKQRISIDKADIWDALLKELPIPQLGELIERPITAVEIYYLLQRFAVLTIWDIYNLDTPAEKRLLNLEGVSKHFNVYDRGSCIVAAPKDLFSYERTLEDALQTARAMAGEVYKRGWTIEFAGFNKMVRAAWVELQVLGDKHGKKLEILHYEPSAEDLKVYSVKAEAKGPTQPSA